MMNYITTLDILLFSFRRILDINSLPTAKLFFSSRFIVFLSL